MIVRQLAYLAALTVAALFPPAIDASAKDFRIYRSHLIKGMPYIQQSHSNTCGAAALAMLLSYHEGRDVTESDILALHPEVREKGFWIPYLQEICQDRVLDTIQGEGTVKTVMKLIWEGRPVIVYQHSRLPKETKPVNASGDRDETAKPKQIKPGRPHFRVVIGFDEKREVFITHDPAPQLGKYYEIPFQQFEKLWDIPWYSDENTTKRRLLIAVVESR